MRSELLRKYNAEIGIKNRKYNHMRRRLKIDEEKTTVVLFLEKRDILKGKI